MQRPAGAAQPRRSDSTLVKALARAFRWKRNLESGEFATIAELAEREWIAQSSMTRVLQLTLLAPRIVEAILDGTRAASEVGADAGPVPGETLPADHPTDRSMTCLVLPALLWKVIGK